MNYTRSCVLALLLILAVFDSRGGRAGAQSQSASQPRPRRVEVDRNTLSDDGGHFLGLGASYFRAMERCKHDRDRYRSDLAFLAQHDFDYIRILSMVGWYEAWQGLEIAPIRFLNRSGNPVDAWPDYWQQVRDTIDIAYDDYGLRTQITIFADAQLMPDKTDRITHMQSLLENLEGRQHKVIILEVANEAWQNGFPGDEGITDLREFGDFLAARTDILIALSDTPSNTTAELENLYRHSAADIATEHFERDADDMEGTWRHVRAPWRVRDADGVPPVSNNEPMGPGSSVRSENDPVKIVCAAAFSYTAGLPMYVFHSEAGVFGSTRFEDQPGVRELHHLKRILPNDLPNWTCNDGVESPAPFTVFADGHPDAFWPQTPGATSGAIRTIGATKEDRFVTLPIGILANGVTLQARRDLFVEAYDPLTGKPALSRILPNGEQLNLPQGSGAYVLTGRFTGADEALARAR